MSRRIKILYLVAEDWYFWSHRLSIARAARDAGLEVLVLTCVNIHGSRIEQEGFRLLPLTLRRRSKNPLRELAAILEISRVYRREKPDIVHHVALKPVLYGALAAKFNRVPSVINALTGLGYVFSSDRLFAKIIKPLVHMAFRKLMNHPNCCVLLQNQDDRNFLIESKTILSERTKLIRGSGVDIDCFIPLPEPKAKQIIVTMVARMLKDKGVFEFVEAVRILKQKNVLFRAVLVGAPDPENLTSISERQLKLWESEGCVEWWGHRDDINSVWHRSAIAVLPSYREGLPKSLLEAAACARPIITTDTPGCREIVLHGRNGLLVPVRDSSALAEAIQKLIDNPSLRKNMGACGRSLVEAEFSESIVVEKTMELYRSMLDRDG